MFVGAIEYLMPGNIISKRWHLVYLLSVNICSSQCDIQLSCKYTMNIFLIIISKPGHGINPNIISQEVPYIYQTEVFLLKGLWSYTFLLWINICNNGWLLVCCQFTRCEDCVPCTGGNTCTQTCFCCWLSRKCSVKHGFGFHADVLNYTKNHLGLKSPKRIIFPVSQA